MGEKAKPTRTRQFSIIGLTMIVVVMPFCLYYFFYVASQTDYYSKRSFRVLSDIGDHISSKIDNLAESLVNVAEKAKQKVESKQPAKPVAVAEKVEKATDLVPDFKFAAQQYASNSPPYVQRALPSKGPSPPPRVSNNNAAPSNRNASASAGNRNIAAAGPTTAKVRRSKGASESKGPESPVTMSVRPEQGSYSLYLEYRGAANALPAVIPVKSDLKTLFEPFVSRYVIDDLNETKERLFDEVLVAEQETGRVIFERGPSGLNVVTLDGLQDDKGAKVDLKLSDQSSCVVSVRLAGTDYKLFLQPVRLTVFSADDEDNKGVRWVVCGLTRTDHFRGLTFAVSYTVLIFFVFGVLLAVLSWPLLKLKLMGPKDRLRRADFGLTVVSALLGTATISFALLDLHTYVSLGDKLDWQLENLSHQIESHFHREIASALEQLEKLNKEIWALPPKDQTEAIREMTNARPGTSSKSRFGEGQPMYSARKELLAGYLDWRTAPYPYFNRATWSDPNGQQRIKWTTLSDTTAFVNVSARQFFKDIRDAKMWKLSDGVNDYEYSFELINSRTTGENVTIIATKTGQSGWASNLDTRLLSLMGTVLPPGFGYAVIDTDGRVLFHSDEIKNLEEQFFAECENNRQLRAAVVSRSDSFINASYLGKGHRLYVRPLSGTPWMLVVFRDKQIARTINLELITLSLMLYLVFAVIMFALIFLIFLSERGERFSWLWPDPRRAGRYELLMVANIAIGFIFIAALVIKSGWFLIACCVIIPILATLLGTFVLGKDRQTEAVDVRSEKSGYGRFLSYRASYAIAFAGFVALVSLLPPVGFFEVARNFELRLMVKHGQVSLAKALEQRRQRVEAQYASLKVGTQPEPAPPARKGRGSRPSPGSLASAGQKEAKDEFLARRLAPGTNSLDVYDSFFFGTERDQSSDGFVDEQLGGVDRLLAWVRPIYNQSCVESQELFRPSSSDQLWRWKTDGGGRIRLEKDKEGRTNEPSVVLTSSLPGIVAPNTFLKWIGVIAAVSVVLLLIHRLVRFVARRFFLLDLDLPDITSSPGTYVLIRDAISGAGKQWDPAEYDVRDLAAVKNWPKWSTEVATRTDGKRTVVLDNFEHGISDPVATAEKLKAIEQLLAFGRRVVVASAVDPSSFSFKAGRRQPHAANNGNTASGQSQAKTADGEKSSGSQPQPPEAMSYGPETENQVRWAAAFANFTTVYAPNSSTAEFAQANPHFLRILKTRRPWRYIEWIGKQILGDGAGSAPNKEDRARDEEQISQVIEQAGPFHMALWRSCSEGQQCTLIQLAQDGMLSPKNKHLRRLVKRGLIVRDPELRLMDESFRRFVLSISHKQDVEGWRREDGGSAWQLLRVPLMLILVGVALFLFVTQKDLYDSTITFLSAATAGIAALLKLLGFFQRGKTGADVQ